MFLKVLVRVDWLADSLGPNVVAFDLRGAEAFAAGHIPGAVPAWPRGDAAGDPASVHRLLAARGISGRETVVLYGGAGDHAEIGHFYWLLERAGCADLKVLDGGLAAWTAAGHPLASGPSARKPSPPPAGGRDAGVVDAGWVAGSFDQPGVELLDVRTDREAWPRGHIPHALPLDVAELLPPNGTWPEPAVIRRLMSGHGPRPGDPVDQDSTFVVYGEGQDDAQPGLVYLLLRMAGFEARVFSGGWQAWKAVPERPVVRIATAAEVAGLLERENPGLQRDALAPGVVLLDLRTARDFHLDHLPGARSLAWSSRFGDELQGLVAGAWPGIDRATAPLVLYCYGEDCVRSRNGGTVAARLGFRNVLWLRSGVTGWVEAGYPLFEAPSP